MFVAIEYKVTEKGIKRTGKKEYYDAATRKDAVNKCLYHKKLSNGKAHVGISGITVYSGDFSYWVGKEKEWDTNDF